MVDIFLLIPDSLVLLDKKDLAQKKKATVLQPWPFWVTEFFKNKLQLLRISHGIKQRIA
jgi:hypothetical protein